MQMRGRRGHHKKLAQFWFRIYKSLWSVTGRDMLSIQTDGRKTT